MIENSIIEPKKRTRKPFEPLQIYYDSSKYKYEICIDECGRGPFLGDVYIACTIIGTTCNFDYSGVKDSKKFSSKKKMADIADIIKKGVLFYHISNISSIEIDSINILQAVFKGMHNCVKKAIDYINEIEINNKSFNLFNDVIILVDGDKFKPYMYYDESNNNGIIRQLLHETIEKGDAKYVGIAAASIIAKVAHDEYLYKLCEDYPQLSQRYDIDKNVGYGTAKHINGIKKWSITQFHRRTFGICKEYDVVELIKGERDE
jgi:ribonuclease HII